MPLHWRPVGPHPAGVYWRRRLLVVAVLAATVVALVLLGSALADDGPAPPQGGERASARPTASPAANPSRTPTAAVCEDGVLEVQASADAARYRTGSTARLALTVRNTGTTACRRALGQGAVELVITSGDDRIWSSDDCAPGGEEGEALLEPGASRTAHAGWPGTRSAPGCPAGQPTAQPGTYRVTGRVGELRVPGAVFQVG